MVSKRSRNGENQKKKKNEESIGDESTKVAAAAAEYEELRAHRIKENKEKMKKLGIFQLLLSPNKQLLVQNSSASPTPKQQRRRRPQSTTLLSSPRRSSRLKDMAPVSYLEKRLPKNGEKLMKDVKIVIKEGSNPEIYTADHEKLLGDCKTTWTLYADGYDEDGHRIYDAYEGKSCHQCRQKTLGHHTKCSKCKLVQGQFCGDCLYMRYGENALEVNEDPGWICPVCRGICNCSRCRKEKGWEPTGAIYKKVRSLGFRSVAHYLIQTRCGKNQEEPAGENNSQQTLVSNTDNISESTDVASKHLSDDIKQEVEENNEGRESDLEYGGDSYDGDEVHEDEDEDEDEDECVDNDD